MNRKKIKHKKSKILLPEHVFISNSKKKSKQVYFIWYDFPSIHISYLISSHFIRFYTLSRCFYFCFWGFQSFHLLTTFTRIVHFKRPRKHQIHSVTSGLNYTHNINHWDFGLEHRKYVYPSSLLHLSRPTFRFSRHDPIKRACNISQTYLFLVGCPVLVFRQKENVLFHCQAVLILVVSCHPGRIKNEALIIY